MGDAKKVSVCLPVFNGEDYLPYAIESVLKQTHSNFELLISDDCSDDQSFLIAKDYAASDSRISCWRNQSRLGLFGNYNACHARVTGEYVKPFAQDDILEANAIEKLREALDYHPTAILASGARIVINGEASKAHTEKSFIESGVVSGEELIADYLSTFFNRVGTPSQVLFKAKNIGDGYDTAYVLSGDVDYWLRLLKSGDLAYIADVVCSLRRHPGSVTVSALREMSLIADAFRLADKHIDELAKNRKPSMTVYHMAVDGLVRKVAHAIRDKAVDIPQKSGEYDGLATGGSHAGGLDFKKIAEHTLLYATEIKAELDETIHQNLKRTADYERQIEDWTKRAEELSAELQTIKSSKAWKLTEPLRKLRMVAR